MNRLFVFGTLKAGFPLHREGLADTPKLCDCRTVQRFPMFVAGPWFAPMMLNEPGQGHRVQGELYEVDDARLALIDRLESVPAEGNLRLVVDIETLDGSPAGAAFAYMKSRALATPVHSPWLDIYRDHRFVPVDRRK